MVVAMVAMTMRMARRRRKMNKAECVKWCGTAAAAAVEEAVAEDERREVEDMAEVVMEEIEADVAIEDDEEVALRVMVARPAPRR